MFFMKSFLNGMKLPILFQTLDGVQGAPIGLHGEHSTGLGGPAIDENGTGATGACIAANMGTRQAQTIAQPVNQ
jgi:hypothetical protein